MKKKSLFAAMLSGAFLIAVSCASTPEPAPAPPSYTPPSYRLATKGPKKRIGIVDFVNKTAYGRGRLGSSAQDILTTELFKTDSFIIVERAQLAKVLDEQSLGQTGVVDSRTAAQLGRVLGLNAIVTGSISQFGVQTRGQDYGVYKKKVQTAECTVDVRVVDASTGQVLFAESGEGYAETAVKEAFGLGQKGGYDETLGQESLRSAVTKFMSNLIQQLDTLEWNGRIAKVSGSMVYVNAGEDTGLNVGDILTVVELGEEIFDPQTGLSMGRVPGRTRGELQVTGFFGKDGSVCRVKSGGGFKTNDLVKLAQ